MSAYENRFPNLYKKSALDHEFLYGWSIGFPYMGWFEKARGDMYNWCHGQFGPEHDRWVMRIKSFYFKHDVDAFEFKMRWG